MEWNLVWLTPYIGTTILILLQLAGIRNEKLLGIIAVGSIGLSALLSLFLALVYAKQGYFHYYVDWIPEIGITAGIVVDGLGVFMANIVSWLSFFIAVYSIKYMEGDWGIGRYWVFFTFFVGSMMLLVLADNLVLMFIGWEGTGLASYALIGHWYNDEEHAWVGDPGRKALGVPMYFTPSHSGLRALLFTRLGDIGFLIGITGLYALTGTFSIPALAEHSQEWILQLGRLGILLPFLILFTLGAFAKSAQFPLHEWLVTAMTGPTPVSALIHAATMVKAGVYFVLRFAPIIYFGVEALEVSELHVSHDLLLMIKHWVAEYFMVIAWIGGITAFMLATMALVSREFKLILAFSTASQLGYMFLGVGVAGLTHAFSLGYSASALHLMSHAVFKAALFLIAGAVLHTAHSRFIDDMGNLSKVMKLTALSMWLAGLSLAGIPPFLGFWTKDAIIEASQEAKMIPLVVLGIVTAVLTSLYVTRVTLRVFHVKPYNENPHLHEARETHPIMLIPYVILALATLLLGLLWPEISSVFSTTVTSSLGFTQAFSLHAEITKTAIITSSLAAIALASIIIVYIIIPVDFRGILARSTVARKIHDFLYDRWYINSIYYLSILGFFKMLVRLLGGVIDVAIDAVYHKLLPFIGGIISTGIRRLHTGLLPFYISLMIAGIALLLYWILYYIP